MKKTLLAAFAFVVIATVSSCKCHTCTCPSIGNYSGKICKSDYNNNIDYNNAVQAAENAGCSCKLSN